MATLNLKAIGAFTKIIVGGVTEKYSSRESHVSILPASVSNKLTFVIDGKSYPVNTITDVLINDVAVTNEANFDARLPEVFPDAVAAALTIALQAIGVMVADYAAMQAHITANPLVSDEFRDYKVGSDTVNNGGKPNKYLYANGVLQSYLIYNI